MLEIGTGTGFNAALLVHRLGDNHVVTLDADADLVEQARQNLADASYTPTVAAADGAQGYPEGAPFDRVIATCSVAAIPPTWLTQIPPGGIGDKRASHLPTPVSEDGQAWVVLADLLMADVSRTDIARADCDVQWLVHPDGSWAYHDTATSIVEQGGPRRPWDELEQIHELWTHNGKPARHQIGLTVKSNGMHHVWLHDDANIVTQPNPGNSGSSPAKKHTPGESGHRR